MAVDWQGASPFVGRNSRMMVSKAAPDGILSQRTSSVNFLHSVTLKNRGFSSQVYM